ncbi:hypothetical protein [Halorussus halophilus]|uniref:hypothetical protein n=1 Tax=Halorussus halophilus TaxID=2650975 RepID=UPI00130171FE|nr:hypothetical protein [Halorussus halophilus]
MTIKAHQLAHSPDDTVCELVIDPAGAGNPEAAVDADDEHYRYSDITPDWVDQEPTVTSFRTNEVRETGYSYQRKEKFERFWRLDNGLDIDPTNPKLGVDAGYYSDKYATTGESDDPLARENHRRADAICQSLELPSEVCNRVFNLVQNTDKKCFNRHGGIDAGILGFSVLALCEYFGFSQLDEIRNTEYWSDVEETADELGVRGTSGRQFRNLIDYIDERFWEGR